MNQRADNILGPFTIIATTFVAMLLISNIAATKLIQFNIGPIYLVFDGGAILFPLTYVLGDVLAEVYGWIKTRKVIILGFVISAAASLTFWIVQLLPPATDWEGQEAFETILGFLPRIVIASLLGYLVGQLLNAYVLVWIKDKWGAENLWVRLLGSSLVGEAADTLVFCTIAFYGVITGAAFWNYVLVGYLYKIAFEILLLPLSYAVIKRVKRIEMSFQEKMESA